jgi:hypothetical protein
LLQEASSYLGVSQLSTKDVYAIEELLKKEEHCKGMNWVKFKKKSSNLTL